VRKVFSLEGPPGDGETSRLGSRDPVDNGTGSEDGFLVWASKPSSRAQHDGDGIRACREASKRRTRGGIA
jgi:hypothetical protein